MAFKSVLLFFVVSVVSSLAETDVKVPVIVWGHLSRESTNPLETVDAADFETTLKDVTSKGRLIAFVEKTLSTEDFTQKDSRSLTVFPYLQSNIASGLYMPSVADPTTALNEIYDKVNTIKLTENGLSAQIEDDENQHVIILLEDAREGESRADMLLRHNNFMKETIENLEKDDQKVFALYTGLNPSWIIPSNSRRKRQAETSNGDGGFYTVDNLLLYASHILLTIGDNAQNLTTPTGQRSVVNETELHATLDFGDNSLTLNFALVAGYWNFESITVTAAGNTEDLLPAEPMYVPEGFSYRCAQNVTFSKMNDTTHTTINLIDLKVQPFFTNSNETREFGDSINCVGFFSAPIWASLFVVFILLAITFYGIMMMMDIRTMDRFDDPKGKTITVGAAE